MVRQIEKRADILGLPVDLLSKEECLEQARNILLNGPPGYIITLNPEIALLGWKDPAFSQVIEKASLVVPDGIGIVWALKRLHKIKLEKVPGIDLAFDLIQLSQELKASVFFLGARPGIAEKAASYCLNIFPKLKIVGTYHGYFQDTEEILAILTKLQPDFLICGMGAGKQEKILASLKQIGYRLGIGVGGAFDIWAGEKRRAPHWLRKMGGEWLFRVLHEPKRLSRLFLTVPFFWRVLWAKKKA